MHIADEIFPKGNEEQYAQHTTERRCHEDFHERCCHLRIFGLKDVNSRKGEDGACHYSSRACSDTLYDDILAKGVRAFCCRAYAYGYDGYRYGSLEHLPHLQSEIGGGSREYHRHDDTPGYGPCVDLRIVFLRLHHRLILLARSEFPECVLW